MIEIFFLVIIGLIIYAIYAMVSRRRRGRGLEAIDPGIGIVRRLYFYIVSFVALMVAANGLMIVVMWILNGLIGDKDLSESTTPLAAGAAMAIVGLPLWIFHWRTVQRHVADLPVETHFLIREFYIYPVLGVAIGISIGASVSGLQWVFGSESFSGFPWAALIVWPALWAFHWKIESREGQPTWETLGMRRLYLYLVSLVTLVMVAVGFGVAIHHILLEAYESLASLPLLLQSKAGLWRDSMRTALALVLVGGGAWGAHWLYFARRDAGSTLRQIYLYVFAILGGVVTILVSLGIILYGALVWLMGGSGDDTAAAHFRFLPGALAALSIGIGLWGYHWMVAQREAEVSPDESQRVYKTYAYILAALGLGTLAVAVGTVMTTFIGIVVESAREDLTEPDFWQNQIALVIILGVVGAPLWGYYWTYIQRQVHIGDAEERNSLPRRIFIFAVLGAGVLALLGSVSFLIFVFLRDALEGELALTVLREAKVAIGIIVAAAMFLPYYWMVYRQDRRAQPEVEVVASERAVRKVVTVLVNEGGGSFVRDLEASLGYEVELLRWADPDASQPQLSEAECRELARRIGEAVGENVLLIPDGAEVRVLSYN